MARRDRSLHKRLVAEQEKVQAKVRLWKDYNEMLQLFKEELESPQ